MILFVNTVIYLMIRLVEKLSLFLYDIPLSTLQIIGYTTHIIWIVKLVLCFFLENADLAADLIKQKENLFARSTIPYVLCEALVFARLTIYSIYTVRYYVKLLCLPG